MVGIGSFWGFMRTRLDSQHWALFSSKTNQGRFIFIEPNSLSQAKDLETVNHMTQAVFRVGLKIGS